ncbi:uncharacterized protein LOC123551350 [Mercenaria mercenaria]|uniref:uncharacterized protein LOC123551350 n=1 Tax=Mercenaria mercenaria TaxID=6596 RepID=UPI001E1D99BD|nr:uncharacterized protein LOC123551350 [Mercenaria mercenaria]XP_045196145.1 uncharacterized protein LOC123551350 [Mercenaria mercenaria]
MTSGKLDAEYNCMRRRMSRARGKVGKGPSFEAEDAPNPDEGGFKDLIKFWKKHGIPIPKDLISDMADENVKRAKAKGQGRRRSRELEDLHMCASTGKFDLEKLNENDEEEYNKIGELKISENKAQATKKPLARRQTDSQIGAKTRGGSLKKTGSRPTMNGVLSPTIQKKPIARSVSNNK